MLPLPISSLRAAKPVLENPLNRHRASHSTFDQFRFSFANAVSEDEANELFQIAYLHQVLPCFRRPTANLNPWTEAKVDTENPDRGPC